jgi:hypothetical protein
MKEGLRRTWEDLVPRASQLVAVQPSTSRNRPRQTKTDRKVAVLNLRDAAGGFQASAMSSGLLKGRLTITYGNGSCHGSALTALLRNDSLTLFHRQCGEVPVFGFQSCGFRPF